MIAHFFGEKVSFFTIFLTILAQSDVQNPNRYNGYLLFAYVVMWLVGLVYVAMLSNRQRNLQQDIQLMQKLLQEDEDLQGK